METRCELIVGIGNHVQDHKIQAGETVFVGGGEGRVGSHNQTARFLHL